MPDSLWSLLADAQEKQGVPFDQQRLVFNGRVLEDSMSLEVSGVQQGCAVHLVRTQSGPGPVQVILPGGRFTTFQVDHSTTASMLSSQISSTTGMFPRAVCGPMGSASQGFASADFHMY